MRTLGEMFSANYRKTVMGEMADDPAEAFRRVSNEDPAFLEEARSELDRLTALRSKVKNLDKRDYVSHLNLEFLQRVMPLCR